MLNMLESKLIMIMGCPGSGKSTLASEVHTNLKKKNKNSIFISEVATDYIAEFGVPKTAMDQMVIFYKQLNKEKMFFDKKEFIICDSSSILNYFYFRQLFDKKLHNKDIAAINNIQKEILKHINNIHKIYFVPYLEQEDLDDGVRFHNVDQVKKLDVLIKSYLNLENIEYVDLSDIDIVERADYIINDLT